MLATGDASRNARALGAAIGRGPFLDCWFTLAALEQDFKEKVRMHDLIRQAGGRIFDAKRVNLVASASSAYAVCPLGFPPNQFAEVLRQPDFRMGEPRSLLRRICSLLRKLTGTNRSFVCVQCQRPIE